MNTCVALRTIAGYTAMVFGIAVGVAVVVVVDVQLALALPCGNDPQDPATFCNFTPSMEYFAIPGFIVVIAVPAVAVNLLLSLIDRRRIGPLRHWVLLGMAYSLDLSSIPIGYLDVTFEASEDIGLAIALACVILVRWRVGVKR